MRPRPTATVFFPSVRPVTGAVSRVGVALLAALFLTAQVAVAIHTATVVHAVCPEHGELIHLDTDHDTRGARADAAGDHGAALDRGVSGEAEHLHDACVAGTSERHAFHLTPPVVLRWRELLVERAQAPPATGADRRAVALYLVAPKHSPPA